MNELEQTLMNLNASPPPGLERRTVFTAGAADLVTRTDSPVGPVWVSWSIDGITAVSPTFAVDTADAFAAGHRRASYETDHFPRDLEDAIRTGLEDGETIGLPIDFRGIGEFQRSVLETCATIPRGAVRPYGWIAEEIHNPGSVRAVGTALGRNPIPLLVPCHRVVKSDGSVGNYAFGADMKHMLLVREGAILA